VRIYNGQSWTYYVVGPYKTDHNIYIDYTGKGELT
jgi:cell division protein FtsN